MARVSDKLSEFYAFTPMDAPKPNHYIGPSQNRNNRSEGQQEQLSKGFHRSYARGVRVETGAGARSAGVGAGSAGLGTGSAGVGGRRRPILRRTVRHRRYSVRNEELLRRYAETKSLKVLHQLVLGNMRLINKLAGRYVGYPGSCLTHEDLVAEGVMGLMQAIQRFDLDKETQLATYATWWIRQRMQRAVMNKGTTVRLPVHVHELIHEIEKILREQEAAGEAKSDDAVCSMLNISKVRYRNARMARYRFLQMASLDQIVGSGDVRLVDLLPDSSSVFSGGPGGASSEVFCDPALLMEGADLARRLREVMAAALTPRERKIISRRFGLDGGRCETLQIIGDSFGVTRERIRQIEARALGRLRSVLGRMGGSSHWRWPEGLGSIDAPGTPDAG